MGNGGDDDHDEDDDSGDDVYDMAITTAIRARATTGERLAYLCWAWQYSALSS